MTGRLILAFVFAAVFAASSLSAQNTPLRRVSPPQPQQAQGLEYFEGDWDFTWTGRESPLSTGPRTGHATFTRPAPGGPLTMALTGTSDAAGAYKESGTMAWDAAKKLLTLKEKLAVGVDLTSTGDWSSPVSIRFEAEPVKVSGKTIRVRRTVGIVSAHSFTVAEEIAVDEGAFVRSGGAVFSKK